VKINTDGVLSLVTHKGGAGGVAMSHSSYLGAWSKPYDGISDSLIAETLALRDGVIFAKLRGFPKMVMKTDCLEVVNLWNTRHESVAPLLQEIVELVLSFSSFSVQYVLRSANHSAHLYAKLRSTVL
jgi:hypothetical protein